MGWAYCGTDDKGREIGYGVVAKCDHPDCATEIDRGLGYICGSMHGGGDDGCGLYFCGEHLAPERHNCTHPQDEHDQTDLGASDDRPLGPDHAIYRK